MRCRHLKAARKVFAEKNGDLNCQGCHDALGAPADKKLYTGKKIWTGTQVNGVDGNKERVAAFGENLKRRAAKNRHRYSEPQHPVLRERIGLCN